ncbi:MAG TPA: RND transporter [Gammaproteobacteria bacterium]
MKLIDQIPLWILLVLALGLGIAPPGSHPHLLEKLSMLGNGTLVRPIDMFDLLLHGIFPVLLVVKLARMLCLNVTTKTRSKNGDF